MPTTSSYNIHIDPDEGYLDSDAKLSYHQESIELTLDVYTKGKEYLGVMGGVTFYGLSLDDVEKLQLKLRNAESSLRAAQDRKRSSA